MLNFKFLIAACALAAGLLLGGGSVRFWYDRVVVPDAIAETIEQQEQACLERVSRAADAARAKEELRQRLAGETVTQSFQQTLATAANAAAEIARRIELENIDYAQILDDTGRSCPLDDDTLDWLQHNGAGDRPGSR